MTLADLSPLANHLWQSSVFAVAAWLLTLALRKNRASVRYWIWFIASVKFLIPFSLLVSIGNKFSWQSSPTIIQPQLTNLIDQISQPFATFTDASAAPPTPHVSSVLPMLLLATWLCGVAVVLIFWLRSLRQIRAIERTASPLPLNLSLPVMSSQARMEPGVFGILHPVLILPEGITNRLTPAQLKSVIAHELCHVRRKDNLTAAVHMLIETIFWFHPMIWWIRTQLVAERERACDESVIGVATDPKIYAEAILNVCKLYVESPLECVAGVTGADLKERIVRILATRRARKLTLSRELFVSAIGLLAIAVPIALGLAQAKQEINDWQEAAGGKMEFEVASIKPAVPGKRVEQNIALNIDNEPTPPGGRLVVQGTLADLVEFAYKFMPTREQEQTMVSHLPQWVASDNFVIEAKAPGSPTKDQMRLMMQSLLADRFKLASHFETRDEPVLALVLDKPGKTGPRLRPHSEGLSCDAKWIAPSDPGSPSIAPGGFISICGPVHAIDGPNHTGILGARDVTIQYLADYLVTIPPAFEFGRPIIDQTGLSGTFDFSLSIVFARMGSSAAGTDALPDAGGPNFDEALKEQLGLKLKPAKAPIQILVIDHVERPSEN
jgi:bla regulator protein BlaR1